MTGILGYVRGRDALETAIYNQLTAQRQSKTRQVENYFRSTADDLRLLAQTKMVADALRDFRHGFEAIQDKAYDVHAYKHTTMGFEKDIAAMPTRYEYSKTFFRRFYRPENVVVLVVGDFDSKEIGRAHV